MKIQRLGQARDRHGGRERSFGDLINNSGDGRLGDPQGSVLLPMQPNIQENTNVKWG